MAQRIALVTGGTRGIGAAICIALKQAGYKVAATYARNHEAAKAFKAEYGIDVFSFDVGSSAACAKGVKQVETALGGPIDVLVNNAGITRDAMMHKMSGDDWRTVIDTNLSSCFYMSKAVIDGMRERKFGRIVNITSAMVKSPRAPMGLSTSARSGLTALCKGLSRRWHHSM